MKKGKVINTVSQLKNLVNKMSKLNEFAFDTETTTLKVNSYHPDFKLVGISISWGEYDNYYIPVGHYFDEEQLDLKTVVKFLKPVFEKEDVRIVGWNLKFDIHVLKRVGINIKTKDLFDGMIASWFINEEEPNGLKENTAKYLKIDQTKIKDVFDTVSNEEKKKVGLKANQKPTFDLVRIDVAKDYALADAYYTFKLYPILDDLLDKEGTRHLYYKIYPQFIYVLLDMEEQGITVDVEKLKKMGEEMQNDIDNLKYKLLELARVDVNLDSTQQLIQLLYGYSEGFKNVNEDVLKVSFKFPIESWSDGGKSGKKKPQVNNSALLKIAKKQYSIKRKQEGIEFCKLLLEYKKLQKLKTAFVDGFFEEIYPDGKMHPNFNIIGTTSGRLSCSSPNLQQLPKADEDDKYKIREVFIGSIDEKTGNRKKILAFDFKNLEMVLLAHFSNDPALVHTFREGHDSHGATAVKMFNLPCTADECKKLFPAERQVGKIINFMLMYGGGASTLYETLTEQGVNMEDEELLKKYKVKNGIELAQKYIDMYFNAYKGVANFIKNQKKFAHRNGYVNTIIGRKKHLPDINSEDYARVAYNERLSTNSTIQGSAADITMNAQLKIAKQERLKEIGCNMLIQIHDELVFECPEEHLDEAIEIITDCMQNPFGKGKDLKVPLIAEHDYGNNYQEAK